MFIQSTNTSEIASKLKSLFGEQIVIISVAEGSGLDIEKLIEQLNQQSVNFIGGIFPKIIYGPQARDYGLVVNTYDSIESIFLVKHLDQKLKMQSLTSSKDDSYCIFTIVDGLSSDISQYLTNLFNHFGEHVSYLGGGAGSLSFQQKACVFNKEGLFKNAAVGAVIKNKVTLSTKHGWRKIAGPYTASKTDRNIILEINGKNAFEVYKGIINTHGSSRLSEDNFCNIAKSFPLGIIKENEGYVVRDPISLNERHEIICVGDVAENSTFDILHGDRDSLIEAASAASNNVKTAQQPASQVYLCDCISRVLFLGREYHKELEAVAERLIVENKYIPIEGALTIGEISSLGNGNLELLNKSLVLALFHKDEYLS